MCSLPLVAAATRAGRMRRRGVRVFFVAILAMVALAAVLMTGRGQATSDATIVENRPITGVTLTITDDNGHRTILDTTHPRSGDRNTVLSLLQANADVSTDFGGWLHSVNGLASDDDALGRPRVWSVYLNGLNIDVGPETRRVRSGDTIWVDRRELSFVTAGNNRAAVAAFPLPLAGAASAPPARSTWLWCMRPRNGACQRVRKVLHDAGIRLATLAEQRLPDDDPRAPARVVVGTLAQIDEFAPGHERLQASRSGSALYIRALPTGSGFDTLDAGGKTPVHRIIGGGGFVATIASPAAPPIWEVAGSSEAGLRRTARLAFNAKALHARVAVFVDARGVHALPESRADFK